ncbi:D-alanine--D-alanine ligase [Parvularcula sp. LCG005]|uniref:D-alanine--D-alanine ligase n=1 Tax=Parvularcula sp. LCG005 TaxID=3078805 RepID=UPI0039794CBD
MVVLKGGWCAERDVSLVSGREAAKALLEEGYDVEEIDATRDIADQLNNSFDGRGPDVVFNALHGPYGEDGRIQSVLEIMGIPYTHSGVLASALAMDKPRAKAVLSAAGLPVPGGRTISTDSLTGEHPLPLPYVLKPVGDGSSFGVYIITSDNQAAPHKDDLDDAIFGGLAMVEPYVRGRELTVAVMHDRPLGITEIIPHGSFYDFQSKYSAGGSKHVLPADVPADVAEAARDLAVRAAQALGCRGVSRTDFRWDDEAGVKGLFILEVNTQPGLTPTSLAPEQAQAEGITFRALVRWMVEDATCPR